MSLHVLQQLLKANHLICGVSIGETCLNVQCVGASVWFVPFWLW